MTTAAISSQHDNSESSYVAEGRSQDHKKKIIIRVKMEHSVAALFAHWLLRVYLAEPSKKAHKEHAESFFSTGNNGS